MKTSGYPAAIWATDIDAVRKGSTLIVSGKEAAYKRFRMVKRDPVAMAELATQSTAISGFGIEAPHARFANASSEPDLISFVRDFGPVVASAVSEGEGKTAGSITANQDLSTLKNENEIFYRCVRIIAELRQEDKADICVAFEDLLGIRDGVKHWPSQWRAERKLREIEGNYPPWRFTQVDFDAVDTWKTIATQEPARLGTSYDELDAAHQVLGMILDAFPPRVQRFGDKPEEGPHWDIRYGIRPCLYFALRNAYLGRSSIELCHNAECQLVFVPERTGQVFCSDLCSRLQRQRDYWKTRGAARRRERRKRR